MERRADFVFNVSLGAAIVLASQLIFDGAATVGESHWWEIVGAIGAVAAVVAAIHVAQRAERRAEQDDERKGMIILRIVAMDFGASTSALVNAMELMRVLVDQADETPVHPGYLQMFVFLAPSILVEKTDSLISQLHLLPGGRGDSAAKVVVEASRVAAQLTTVSKTLTTVSQSSRGMMKSWLILAGALCDDIRATNVGAFAGIPEGVGAQNSA